MQLQLNSCIFNSSSLKFIPLINGTNNLLYEQNYGHRIRFNKLIHVLHFIDHYIVPELTKNQQFSLNVNKPLKDFLLAKSECNLVTKPVLLGPITFLHLSHVLEEENRVDHLKLLPSLLSAYAQVYFVFAECAML